MIFEPKIKKYRGGGREIYIPPANVKAKYRGNIMGDIERAVNEYIVRN